MVLTTLSSTKNHLIQVYNETHYNRCQERIVNPNSLRLDVEVLEHEELWLHLLFFLDRTFFRALLSINLSNTCRIVECFLSNGFGNIFVRTVRLLKWVWFERPIVGRLQNYKVKFRCGQVGCLIQFMHLPKLVLSRLYLLLIACWVGVLFICAEFPNSYKSRITFW